MKGSLFDRTLSVIDGPIPNDARSFCCRLEQCYPSPFMCDDTAARLRTALILMERGIAMQRQRFRREYPKETHKAINKRLQEWMESKPVPPGCHMVPSTEDSRDIA